MQASMTPEWTPLRWIEQELEWPVRVVLKPLQILTAAPCLLFFAALSAMLLRHPDVQFYEIDRVAFGLLLVSVGARALVLREQLFVLERATWPMLGITVLALASVAGQPFNNETWNLLASKFIVPFALFHIAALVFTEERRLRQFEIFGVVVLAYLSFTAIAFLCGLHWLIFPRFILDESLGFHADRARGPLLQAVANGVSLNLLAILALHAYRRRSIGGAKMVVLLTSVPLAILATMTRAVWISFSGTLLAAILLSTRGSVRRTYVAGLTVAAIAALLVLSSSELGCVISERLHESGPLEYRQAVYSGGWEMFLQRPLTGWGFHEMPAELPRHVTGYKQRLLYPHNTYLELLVEHGVLGLALYLWLMWELWRLGRGAVPISEKRGFLSHEFHRLWPIILAAYWINAAFVVMSYQFVNGLLFTMAGMLAAQRRRTEMKPC